MEKLSRGMVWVCRAWTILALCYGMFWVVAIIQDWEVK
jgi:hypothetical protein